MRFQFHPGLTLATLIALAILSVLGTWQLQRRAWKLDLIAQTEQRLAEAPLAFDDALTRAAAGEKMEYAPVFIDGVYAHDLEAPVFGTYEGAPGFYVFTPLVAAAASDDARIVYVNRGFAPQAFRAPETRSDGAVDGEVRVYGLFRTAERRTGIARWVGPIDQPSQNIYFTRDPLMLAAPRGVETVSYYIDSDGRESAGPWPRGGVTRIEFNNRHLEYALTWFGLAAALLAVYAAFSLKRD